MAGQFTGMDIPAVKQLAAQLKAKGEAITQISQELTSLLENTPWVGPDQQRYVSEWRSTHVTALRNVVQGLNDASNAATRNAQEQETASNG